MDVVHTSCVWWNNRDVYKFPMSQCECRLKGASQSSEWGISGACPGKSPIGDDLPGVTSTQKDLTIMPQPHRRPCPHLTTTAVKLKPSCTPLLASSPLPMALGGGGWVQTSPLGGEKGQAHHIPSHCSLTQVQAGAEVKFSTVAEVLKLHGTDFLRPGKRSNSFTLQEVNVVVSGKYGLGGQTIWGQVLLRLLKLCGHNLSVS